MTRFWLASIGFVFLFILAMSPEMAASRSGATYEFNVDGDLEGWGQTNSISTLTVAGGTLQCTVIGEDPYFASPLFSINAAENPLVLIRMKVSNPGDCQIYWETVAEPNMDEEKVKVFQSGEANEWQLYVLNMTAHPKWTGVIRRFRIDPPESAGQVEVDYARICPITDIIDNIVPEVAFIVPDNQSISWNSGVLIGARYSDNSPIDLDNVVLKIDGSEVKFGVSVTDRLILYSADFWLGSHNVELVVRDNVGNAKNATLTFLVLPWTTLVLGSTGLLAVLSFILVRRRKSRARAQHLN